MLDVRWPPSIVRDANRQALAYVYCEDEPGRRAAAKLLAKDEARPSTTAVCPPRQRSELLNINGGSR
jgi:hypothetical protein